MIREYLPDNFLTPGPKRLEATAPAGGTREALGKKAPPLTAKGSGPRRLDEPKDSGDDEIKDSPVPIHCKKWIDYTSKYGLGYVLSNGSVGVFFNDATKIILDLEGVNFDYHERKSG